MRDSIFKASLLLTFLLLNLLDCCQAHEETLGVANCPETELKKIGDQSKTCQETAYQRFAVNPTEDTLCRYLEEVVVDCTKAYAMCYADMDVERLRDVRLRVEADKLMKLFGIEDAVLKCPIVAEYESRTQQSANLTFSATRACADVAQVEASVDAFRTCTEGSRSVLVSKFGSSNSKLETRKRIICDALMEMTTKCYAYLERCYDEEELGRMRQRQLEFMATFFYHIADKVGFSVKQCEVFKLEETGDGRHQLEVSVGTSGVGVEAEGAGRTVVAMLLVVRFGLYVVCA